MAKQIKNKWVSKILTIKINAKKFRHILLPSILSLVLFFLLVISYQVYISDKFYPRTYVGKTNISFLKEGEAIRKVQTDFLSRTNSKINFAYSESFFEIDLATSSANIDYSMLNSELNSSHSGMIFDQVVKQFQDLLTINQISPKISLSLEKQMDKIASVVNQTPQDAQLFFNDSVTSEGSPSASIQIKDGVNGMSLDRDALQLEVSNYLLTGHNKMQLPIKSVPPKITTAHVQKAKQALESTLKDPIVLKFENSTWTIDTKQLLTLLDLQSDKELLLDKERTDSYLEQIAENINQEVQEGLFEFNPATKRVSAFKASQDGRKLDIDKTYQLISDSLSAPDGIQTVRTITLPVAIVKSKIQTADVNSLGIDELIGRGISNFAGSIPNRIYNVNLTAQKINGVLIPPGEVFSFNQTVGDITAATGFKQAYVIKEGRTVLDDGGGVCQGSTTIFRAALNAGLPILKRTAHAYRVGYYEQGFPPGLDATIYYPSVDFQFKNDTNHHILVQAYTQGLTLYVDLYGTSDGRVANITKSIVSNQTPPPTELRQDDPSLPRGTVKQVDFPAWGATVTFKRTVTRAGQTLIDETFRSNYKAWQAVYLIGTKDN